MKHGNPTRLSPRAVLNCSLRQYVNIYIHAHIHAYVYIYKKRERERERERGEREGEGERERESARALVTILGTELSPTPDAIWPAGQVTMQVSWRLEGLEGAALRCCRIVVACTRTVRVPFEIYLGRALALSRWVPG